MQITVNVTREDIERGKRRDPGHRPIARAFKRLGEPMRTLLRTLLIFLLAPAAVAFSQEPPKLPSRSLTRKRLSRNLRLWQVPGKEVLGVCPRRRQFA